MQTLDFIIDRIGYEPEPIAQITIAAPIGSVWIVQLKDDLYQAQIRGSSTLPIEYKPGVEVLLVNDTSQLKVKSISSNVDGCFNLTLDEGQATCFAKHTSEASVLTVKPLFKFKDWNAGAEAQYQLAEELRAGIYERAQPINTIVKALLIVDAAVERWDAWDKNPETIPETDLEGNLLTDIQAGERYSFYKKCQKALTEISEEAATMRLAEPIDYAELTISNRKAQIMMISSALGISPKHTMFTRMAVGKISEIWSIIADLMINADNPTTAIDVDLLVPELEISDEKKSPTSHPGSERKSKSKK